MTCRSNNVKQTPSTYKRKHYTPLLDRTNKGATHAMHINYRHSCRCPAIDSVGNGRKFLHLWLLNEFQLCDSFDLLPFGNGIRKTDMGFFVRCYFKLSASYIYNIFIVVFFLFYKQEKLYHTQ